MKGNITFIHIFASFIFKPIWDALYLFTLIDAEVSGLLSKFQGSDLLGIRITDQTLLRAIWFQKISIQLDWSKPVSSCNIQTNWTVRRE